MASASKAVDYKRTGIVVPKGVLRRKFVCPDPPDGYRLSEGRQDPIVQLGRWRVCLVTSFAGYGKTSMLSAMHQSLMEDPCCIPLWTTLYERDADVGRFIATLGYCLSALDPRFSAIASSADADCEDALIDMLNLLDELSAETGDVYLFLDNYGAASCAEVDNAVLYLNRNAPDDFHLVIAAEYFRPQIDDLLLAGDVIEVSNGDLLMEPDDLRDYADRLLPGLSAAERADAIEEYGHWPMAYQFRALAECRASGKAASDEVFANCCQRFFTKQVLDRVDDSTADFLIETSLLETMEPRICDMVTGRTDSADILRGLAQRNLFCSYDPVRQAYAYEHMFRGFLRGRLLAMQQTQLTTLARRASEAYRDLGKREHYAKYLVMTCDPLFLIGSIRSSTNVSTDTGGLVPLAFFLRTPAERYVEDELLIWCVIWSLVSAGIIDEVEYWIQKLTAVSEGSDSKRAADYVRAICLALEGDNEGSIKAIDGISEREGRELPQAFRCLLTHMKGEDCERLGNLKEGRDLYQKGLSLSKRFTTSFYKLFDLYLLAHQYYLLGIFDEALVYTQRGLSSAGEGSAIYGEFNTLAASVLIEQGELDEGGRMLDKALACVSLQTNIDMYTDTYMALARLHIARGNVSEAYAVMTVLLDDISGRRVPRNLNISALSLALHLALAVGDQARAYGWRGELESFADNPDVLRAVQCQLALIVFLRFEGDLEGALSLVGQCEQRIESCGSRLFAAQCAMFKAAVLADLGRGNEARISIMRSLDLSMRGGYLMMYRLGGQQVYQLILELAARQKGHAMMRAHANRILAVIGDSDREEQPTGSATEVTGFWSLTEREREVMSLLNQGLSRAEIAQAKLISQNTVKTHIKNIYYKLGVHSRSEVLRIAQENSGE